jgi:hypothetical protein
MSRQFDLTPRPVARVDTALRRIVTPLPAPESLPIIESLHRHEPVSMQGQPPIVWDRAEGFQVFDGGKRRARAARDDRRHHRAGSVRTAS